MRHLRVCIYGGTKLSEQRSRLIADLAYAILASMPAVVVTGGFVHSHDEPNAVSTDISALIGAREYATDTGVSLRECYEAWIPQPDLDRRPDVHGAMRMSEADGITVRVMAGRTPLGRRLAMVAGVNAVVTVSGKKHTEVVVEQALELGVPVVPIPIAGGDSRRLLKDHRARIAASFAPGALDGCLTALTAHAKASRTKDAAAAVVELLRTAKLGKCLVLTPYDDEHNRIYAASVADAVSKHMIPVRLDELPRSDAIYTSFTEAVRTATAVIADVTTINSNVMYEVGYAHGCGLRPLIYTRMRERLNGLPVYLRTLNVRDATSEPLEAIIDEYLQSFMAVRRQLVV